MPNDLFFIVFGFLIFIFSAVIHEYAHGAAAEALGDSTPRAMGRMTMNPLVHLEVFGSFLLPILLFISGASFIIGWAKPVVFNPNNLRDKKFGVARVAAAGPLANISMAVLMALILRFVPIPNERFVTLLAIVVYYNLLLAIFNLIPIPPLDGSKFLFDVLPAKYNNVKVFLSQQGPWLLLILLIADSFLGLGIFGRIIGFFVNLIYSLV